MRPVKDLLGREVGSGVWVDPFARNSKWAEIANDLDPDTSAEYHLEAVDFLRRLRDGSADGVLFDPPYSPRQISEQYKRIGLEVHMEQTQNARLYKAVKDEIDRILKLGGRVICFGWNSNGMGKTRGYKLVEVLLIAHGAAHNDTIVTVEIKT